MMQRPSWAVAMAVESSFKTHLRQGWNAYTGTRTHCGAELKFPKTEMWVSLEDIQKDDIVPDGSQTRSCERCIGVWLRKAERTG